MALAVVHYVQNVACCDRAAECTSAVRCTVQTACHRSSPVSST